MPVFLCRKTIKPTSERPLAQESAENGYYCQPKQTLKLSHLDISASRKCPKSPGKYRETVNYYVNQRAKAVGK